MLTAHAYIDVTAAEPAIAFYCDGLGLTVKRRLSPTWIELAGANLPIFLLAHRPPFADLDAAVARLIALGGSLDRAIADRDYGRIAYMADPFGNGFDLIEFSGAGYDGIARRT